MAASAGGGRNFDLQIKLMMIGDTTVGKTSLLLRFADDDFNESVLATIGIDFKIKTMEIDGRRVKLQIWDTAGQERFRTITQAYYRGAMGIFLIYDVTKAKTWENIRNWVANIEANAPQTVNKVLIGNKSDLSAERQLSAAQGQQLAEEYGMKFFECSARTRHNVDAAFVTLARDVVARLGAGGGGGGKEGGGGGGKGTVSIGQVDHTEKKGTSCCAK
ncbi:hypothetical protein KFE25_002317 [Diacronema lutheri]|uniref:Uncharacterized protein n=1 Tax=Diacronema lutheri TaxID=2081491 RepID=A0A8J5X1Z8_DIALT|nr:hypothetical protein KFE25_002317 [Diacronema lutheri]